MTLVDPYEGAIKLIQQLKAVKKEKKGLLMEQFSRLLAIDVEEIRNKKHPTATLTCPYCNQQGNISSYGRFNSEKNRYRYLCKSCKKHFNDYTGTLFHNRKLRFHLLPFINLMLEGASIRKIATDLAISPTTVHSWRHLILAYIERHMDQLVDNLKQNEDMKTDVTLKSSTEISLCEINPSHKGFRDKNTYSLFTSKIEFCYNRSGFYYIQLRILDILKPKRELIREYSYLQLDDKLYTNQPTTLPVSPVDRRLLHHCKYAQNNQNQFTNWYRQMRGVAQPYLKRYLQWHSFLSHINKLSASEKLRAVIVACI